MEDNFSSIEPSFGVRMVKGENAYSVKAEGNKKRHVEYCRNIVSVPPGSYISDVIGKEYEKWELGDDI